jgi:GT2 family glycosyltransferase
MTPFGESAAVTGTTGQDRPSPAELVCSSSLAGSEIHASVVIPSVDRPAHLLECLEGLAALSFPATRFEVIVVDDGSKESLEPVVRTVFGRLNVSLLRQANRGPATARNRGAASAAGRWVCFIDDDCRPDPGWLAALTARLEVENGAAVGGPTVNGLPDNILSAASHLLLDYMYQHWNRSSEDALFLASSNVAFPRQRFAEIGGFDARFPLAAAEDRDLCDRWRALGGRIVYAPEAVVQHFHARGPRTFLRQHFNYGRGAATLHRVRRSRVSGPLPRFEGGSFYLPLVLYPFSTSNGLRAVPLLALILLSQVAMILGYAWQRFLAAAPVAAATSPERSPALPRDSDACRPRNDRSPGL